MLKGISKKGRAQVHALVGELNRMHGLRARREVSELNHVAAVRAAWFEFGMKMGADESRRLALALRDAVPSKPLAGVKHGSVHR